MLRALTAYCIEEPMVLRGPVTNLASVKPHARSPEVEPPLDHRIGQIALDGWLDRMPDAGKSDTQTYAAQFAAEGDAVEDGLTGNYAAAVWEPDGTLRLARSPWHAPPLHYAIHEGEVVASSTLRAIFAFGVPKVVDRQKVRAALRFDEASDPPAHWYENVYRVPLGTVLRIRQDGRVITGRRYDPHKSRIEVPSDPGEWVGTARTLIDRSAELANARAGRPAMSLSGGLDSPIAAEALLRTRDRSAKKPAFVTVLPSERWDGIVEHGKYGSEAGFVEKFCAMHGIETSFTREGGFDLDLDELHRASGITSPFIGNGGMIAAAYRKARELRADWFFDAVSGNDTLSADGKWSYPAMLAGGQWKKLYRALEARTDDPRTMSRKFAALAALPLLPQRIRTSLRRRFSQAPPPLSDHASLLRKELLTEMRPERPQPENTRAALVDYAWAASDSGMADLDLGREQLYGLRRRDIFAYRPLIEFCMSLPDNAYLRDGTDRWLARVLGRGIMPEAQRCHRLYGSHNADWHHYLSNHEKRLRRTFEAIESHPWLCDMIDVDRARSLLDDLPDRTPLDPETAWPLQFGLVGTAALARFVAQVEGRNAF